MNYSFQRYLLAKQTIDDRALNRQVLDALKLRLPHSPIRVIEIGGGIGSMFLRLLAWETITRAEYILEDELADNIEFAKEWIPKWAAGAGFTCERMSDDGLRIRDARRDLQIRFESSDLHSFISKRPQPADLLIAHAFLDLLPLAESMSQLLSLTRNLAWMTINFDGVTAFEPTVDSELDRVIEQLYHMTMDIRPSGGDSRAGRHLFKHLKDAGAKVLAAGSSDWVIFPQGGKYPADEQYFLHCIIQFLEDSLTDHPNLDGKAFEQWLQLRRNQIDRGELIYIAHQLDYLVEVQT